MRFKHSRMHWDNGAPGISKPSRGPSPNPLKNLLPNRNHKTQRKLRPDPLITRLRLRPIMILSSKKVLPSDPGDPIELTALHYPYPFLRYFPAFWHGQPFLCPEINHPPGLQVSTISNSVHFTDTRAIPSKSVILCVMSSMTWMMKIVSIGTKLRHTWKPPMSLKLLIWGSILIQCHNIKGDKSLLRDLHRYKLIPGLLPFINFLSSSSIFKRSWRDPSSELPRPSPVTGSYENVVQ